MVDRAWLVCVAASLWTIAVAAGADDKAGRSGAVAALVNDKACGPRCLWAVMQLTGVGQTDLDVPGIYSLMGRPAYSPVTMKDLRDAARKLGFDAQGRSWVVSDLAQMEGYAILPIRRPLAPPEDPCHFILVAGALRDQAMIVDTGSLEIQPMPMDEFQGIWAGPALVICADGSGKRLLRPLDATRGASDRPFAWQTVDLGLIEVGSRLKKTLVVAQKDGGLQWSILAKSCSCLGAQVSLDERGQVVLSVELEVKVAGKQVTYVSVGPKDSDIRRDYRLVVYGKNAHRIEPLIGCFEVQAGRAEYPVVIEYFPGDVNSAVSFGGFETDITGLSHGDVARQEILDGKWKVVRFTIPLVYVVSDPLIEKTLKGIAKFRLNTQTGQRLIQIDMTVHAGKSPLQVTPPTLFFLCSKSVDKSQEKKMRVTSVSNGAGRSLSIQPDLPIAVRVDQQRVSDSENVLTVAIGPSELRRLVAGVYKGKICLGLEGEQSETKVFVPVSIVVRE